MSFNNEQYSSLTEYISVKDIFIYGTWQLNIKIKRKVSGDYAHGEHYEIYKTMAKLRRIKQILIKKLT